LKFRFLLETTIALFVFASAYALIRIALSEIPPLTLGGIRFVIASGVMIPFAVKRHRSDRSRFNASDVLALLGLGVVQIVIPNALQNIGMEYTTASVSSVLQSTTPVFTLALSFTVLKERVTARDLMGMVIGMIGVTLLSTGGDLRSLGGLVLIGNLLQVAVAASYAASGIVGKVLLKRHDPILVVSICFVIGAVVLTVLAFLERTSWPSSLSGEVIAAVLILSLSYCIGLFAWYDALQHTNAFRLYVLLFTMPILAVAISVVVLNEAFTSADITFSAITLVGVALTQFRRRNGEARP